MTKEWEGFSKKRTVRVLGIVALVFGIVLIAIGFALNFADGFASKIVEQALARYGNFTGKIALNTFAEDRELMQIILTVRDELLPIVGKLIPCAFVLGFALFSVGIFSVLFPELAARGLLSAHVLKLSSTGESSEDSPNILQFFRLHSQGVFIAAGVSVGAILGIFLIFQMADPARKTPLKVAELEREASRFYQLQRDYFAKNKLLGSWEQLGYAPLKSEYFHFEKTGKFAWRARNRDTWENCPDSSSWKVSFEVTGLFTKELKVYTSRPNDKRCEVLTPEFRKNVLHPAE